MLKEIENFNREKQVEEWYYKTIEDNNLCVFHQFPMDGVIYIKGQDVYGVLETKFDRSKNDSTMKALRQAFVQAIWYTFQVYEYNFKFFMIGDQKHFGIFYLDDYKEFIDFLKERYDHTKLTASEAGRMYCDHKYLDVLDLGYHNIQQKLNQLQNVFKS